MERRPDAEKRRTTRSGTVIDARASLALWLRAGRAQRGLSLDDVARVTKIQPRILERLESGKADGLPADVFVRGFVRSFARCVGLDEDEALTRYSACGEATLAKAPAAARAMVEAMADLAPTSARAPRILVAEAEAVEATGSGAIEVIDVAPFAAGSLGDLPAAAAEEPVIEPIAEEISPEIAAATEPAPAPVVEEPAVVMAPPADMDLTALEAAPQPAAPKPRAKRTRKAAGTSTPKPRKRKGMALGTPSEPTPVIEAPVEAAQAELGLAPDAEPIPAEPIPAEPVAAEPVATAIAAIDAVDASVNELPVVASDVTVEPALEPATDASEPAWTPRMPPVSTASVPWRRGGMTSTAPAASLVAVIDDADPEGAERALEERRNKEPRRSFLPPILLDREDRSARQGGLTLAVIILLIAATLTLSYLMRRPSSSGDGVTQASPSAETLA